MMKRKVIGLSRRYTAALRNYLGQGPGGSLLPARGLGRQAVDLRLETLDLALMHEEALATLEISTSRDRTHKRAETFFTEAVAPIEKTHRAALKARTQCIRANKTLERRTGDLAASQRSLKQSIIHRKTVEKALKKSGGDASELLNESRRLQKHLQDLTHEILRTQEDKRKKISRHLQNEIAQTLLGINVRLLTLKKEASVNAKGLRKDIASTRQLVDKSVKSIQRFARAFGRHHDA
jgi:signal transduction histidine kinase